MKRKEGGGGGGRGLERSVSASPTSALSYSCSLPVVQLHNSYSTGTKQELFTHLCQWQSCVYLNNFMTH